ncbi:hypothetical protein FH972_008937 [Carpinus fangiana]|uniref:SPX domain-containing protein n=1 Tax=Carpinus fangiana TaxID=176857 RepID=A0A5N6R3D0_9ROSI|nr:hypothetical protein FH972_008937 [Carpinus fangiana]
MKFGKQFTAQMVPEWQEAYMNYNNLKTLLKEIQHFRQINRPPPTTPAGLKRKAALYRAFSGLTQRYNQPTSPSTTDHDIETQAILVKSVNRDGSQSCQTTSKVEEVMKEAATLNKQMDALIAFRIKVENPHGSFDMSVEMSRLASDVSASTAALSASTPRGARASNNNNNNFFFGRVAMGMDVIEESGQSSHGQSEEWSEEKDEKETEMVNQKVQIPKPKKLGGTRPAPLEVLKHVKMNITKETPRSTIKGFLQPSQTELEFSRENLKKVEGKLKLAFVEFYQKLRLLRSYSFLNTLAFSKIMKKYDKITSRKASKSYMKMVDNSFLGSSDEMILVTYKYNTSSSAFPCNMICHLPLQVSKLMERVEATFTKHFSNSNRNKAMSILRPMAKRDKHRITFSMGFFAGCTAALIVALILIIPARGLMNTKGGSHLFGFIVLHMLMYGANIYFWRRYRVNYSFIFGFKEGTDVGYLEVLLLSFGLAALALASVLSNLDMHSPEYNSFTELLPLNLVFVQALRSLEFYICYYGWGDYKRRKNTCITSGVYRTFCFIVAVIPYWSRLLQTCTQTYLLPSLTTTRMIINAAGTYIYIPVSSSSVPSSQIGLGSASLIFSACAAIVSTYWDLVIDWGLLQRQSKNRWLRDKLLVPHKSVYFVAMVLNVFLRFAWMQTVLGFQVSFLHAESLVTIVACLEIIRRGIWNFFRLENEHLNNVGNFRAFKSVPLPFNYDGDDDKDE